ncbi:hypothetical protein F9282_14620 [Proteus terrae subsp. cibarius]|uniref:Phage protein n=1 Tax=Proteus terrae subsp. cibarius TaxID=626774 RepID=A0ABX6JIC2_9GAMM|nr:MULTISPECIES: hypothetical protein [Proteus]NBM88904.1 hypothetical protein [Proteus sp. G2658]QGW04147.1 hypothetical protein F9282_14620 [Proteus terrae subsp. cibarius]QIF88845.1 hypothetical protein GTH23_01805 [Proteus terrae subsp. cibarius]
MKRNIDDFYSMSDFIISIITVVAWVLIGSIIAVGYFTIETKGESIILSFTSTIFTIISSLGIVATIGVYFWQRNDIKIKQNENDDKFFIEIKEIARNHIKICESFKKSFQFALSKGDSCEFDIVKNPSLNIAYLEIRTINYVDRISIYPCDFTINLDMTRINPAILSKEKYELFLTAKLTIEHINNFAKQILSPCNKLYIKEMMEIYLNDIHNEYHNKLKEIIDKY